MAKVKTFIIHDSYGVKDSGIAEFITEAEGQGFYVNTTCTYVPYPTPRIMVIVTKLDDKEEVKDK